MTDSQKITVWTTQEVISVLRALAREDDLPSHLIDAEITGEDTVDSLGIDSLGGAYLIERLEQITGVLMPDEFLDLKDNIATIAERLNQFVRSKH
jgi:acyl carrier protein